MRAQRRDDHPLTDVVMVMALIVLTLASIVLALLTTRGHWLDVPRAHIADTLKPARQIVAAPFAGVRGLSSGIRNHFAIVRENARLREENARLRAWYDLAQTMADKMDRYERLLQLNPEPVVDVVSTRVIADYQGPFVRARLLNAGAEDGVEIGHAVMTERGLLGRVVATGQVTARTLLLTDINSRVPVMVARNDVRAILAGDNSRRPRLDYLPAGHGLLTGDRIVTSGDGGELPRGLPVGEAVADARGEWRVRLYASDAPYDYARVVRFAGPAVLDEDTAREDLPDTLREAPS